MKYSMQDILRSIPWQQYLEWGDVSWLSLEFTLKQIMNRHWIMALKQLENIATFWKTLELSQTNEQKTPEIWPTTWIQT